MVEKVVAQEPREQLYCGRCRTWKVTQEKFNMFATVDGQPQAVRLWVCPDCRGEGHAPVAEKAKTQADVAKDERLGPYRAVAEVVKVNEGGKSARVKLECGHEVTTRPDAKRERCAKCVNPALKGFHNRHED